MANVTIEHLTKRFAGKPPTVAVDAVDLEIAEGEFLVLLGPSGCGKTTTLRCIAGLETPDEGRVSFGDNPVFDADRRHDLPPDKRNIGMVFQSYALWPHMTVRKNIGYPLRTRKIKGRNAERMITETAEVVDCAHLLDRYPGQLSGGQQQRIALARGLVAQPDVVLFDEPMSNLDARLRDSVRSQLHELHRRLGFTAAFVTHDQSEALALGDRLAIMRSGTFEQVDTPERVFDAPATEYVADFIGMSNRIPLSRATDGWLFGEHDVGPLGVEHAIDELVVRLSPDDLMLGRSGDEIPDDVAGFGGEVVDAQFGGRHMDVIVQTAGTRLHVRVPADAMGGAARRIDVGQPVVVGFRPTRSHLYDANGARVELNGSPAVAGAG